ncbi:Aste57867_12028 [Aphanomyces stellatus]|uniref:Aste57867_12028 protein n=1 Tax=Aphanomyces stellatus TaxID=120398 RepID=A0A485KVA5_9STRA|nr:hypothetical protein As57867_011983 [Aphanomyces stellatus]VFT88883.1 Aste57867_12028 [Aphanomyces stellatus]
MSSPRFQRWAFAAAAAPQRQLRSHTRRHVHTDSPELSYPAKKPRVRTESASTASPIADESATCTAPPSIDSDGNRILHTFSKLVGGQLIKRYKRFLADIQLDDGEVVTVHCPNTGPMVGLLDIPNAPVQLSVSDNPKRKYAHTLEMIQVHNGDKHVWVGVHSASANRMVKTALQNGWLPEVVAHRCISRIQTEVKHTKDSRIDFVIDTADGSDQGSANNATDSDDISAKTATPTAKSTVYAEVKSVTLAVESMEHIGDGRRRHLRAVFPDTVSARASKHVEELIHLHETKPHVHGAIVFLVQRGDCASFAPAAQHDPTFAALCARAKAAGLGLHAYACDLVPESRQIRLLDRVPLVFE